MLRNAGLLACGSASIQLALAAILTPALLSTDRLMSMTHVAGPGEGTRSRMNWRPLVRFLRFALLIDVAVFIVGSLI